MRTAVDSSVLLDVFSAAKPYVEGSRDALRRAIEEGSLIVGEVVWAEVSAHFETVTAFRKAMETLGIGFVPGSEEAAELAGRAWSAYRSSGGRRQQLIPDFLVAAHAQVHADRLLTRDRGFSRGYFEDLTVWDPSK